VFQTDPLFYNKEHIYTNSSGSFYTRFKRFVSDSSGFD